MLAAAEQLIGRAAEIEALRNALAGLDGGEGRAVEVVG